MSGSPGWIALSRQQERPFAAIPSDLNENGFTNNAIVQIIAATGMSVHDGDPRLWVNFDPTMLR